MNNLKDNNNLDILNENTEELLQKEENIETNEVNIKPKEQCINEEMSLKDDIEGLNNKDNINMEKNEKDKTTGKFLHKYTILIAVVSLFLFIGLIIFSTVFGLINRNSNKIVAGVSINLIDISNLTKEEAREKIISIYDNKLKQNITLKHNDYELTFALDEILASFGIDETIDLAYSIGRSGKILKDNYTIINTYIGKVNIIPSFKYNEEKLMNIINEANENLPDKVIECSYYVENDKLIITKGKTGYSIKKDELKVLILNYIMDFNHIEKQIDIPVILQEPENVSMEKIHTDIFKEPKDAYYTKDPFTVYPHVIGVDFNITMEEAKKLINNDETTVTIPLKFTTPNVTTNQIGTEAFPDLLASYSTTFSTSNTNRTTNIKLSSNKVNGVVLMPGEVFSYNKVVGQRTAAAGYKSAPVYVGGRVENGIGGGICQVSSTLYNTALRANLEIIKRSNHRFATGYVPLSTDATVSWGGPEFIFKNSRKYPIKIVSTVTGGKIKVDIYGCKEEVEYEVTIKSETIQIIPMKTEYRTNTSLPTGTTKTVQKGHAGYKSRAYRILKLNGQIVSKQLLSTDTYAQLPTIIEKN